MANTTLTIALNGDVPLLAFTEAMQRFNALISALVHEVGGGAEASWLIEELHGGSAVATVRGEATEGPVVEKVVRAYQIVGRALQANEVIPYSERVEREARAITSVLDGKITSIRFTTDDEDAIIYKATAVPRPMLVSAYGAVEGHIHTLTSRNKLSFTLYDILFDRAVTCYLSVGQEELMRDVWGKRAIVVGYVSRDPLTGRPEAIRNVTAVQVVEEVPAGADRDALGILNQGDETVDAVEAIRRVRDGQG